MFFWALTAILWDFFFNAGVGSGGGAAAGAAGRRGGREALERLRPFRPEAVPEVIPEAIPDADPDAVLQLLHRLWQRLDAVCGSPTTADDRQVGRHESFPLKKTKKQMNHDVQSARFWNEFPFSDIFGKYRRVKKVL